MADEMIDTTTGGIASNPTNTGTPSTPAPASAGAGVPVSNAIPDVGLMPGAPVRESQPIKPIVEEEIPDVGLVRPASAPPLPKAAPSLPSTQPAPAIVDEPNQRPAAFPSGAQDGAMQADIQKILGSIKLPERRTEAAHTAPEQKQISVAPIEAHLEKPVQVGTETAPEKPIAPAVHTLKDDIQHVVRVEKMSLVRAASLEEDHKIREQQPEPDEGAQQRKNRTRTILAISGLLVVLGVAALFGVFLVMNQYSASPQETGPTSLIFAEQNLLLPLDNASPGSLKQQVAQLRTAQVGSLGSITRIIPTISELDQNGTPATRPATTQEFLKAIGATIPDELSRSLGTDFFFGMHSADKNAPVLVIPVLSYDNAFAGMLSWENLMNGDLAPMFTPLSPYRMDADGIPQARMFQDAVIRNYDTRTLSDDGNTIELYYSFPAPNILVIAESPYTFAEVISRLRAQRRL